MFQRWLTDEGGNNSRFSQNVNKINYKTSKCQAVKPSAVFFFFVVPEASVSLINVSLINLNLSLAPIRHPISKIRLFQY